MSSIDQHQHMHIRKSQCLGTLSSVFRGHVWSAYPAQRHPAPRFLDLSSAVQPCPARDNAALTCDSPAIFLSLLYKTTTTYPSTTHSTSQEQHQHPRVTYTHHGSPPDGPQRRLSWRRRLQMGRCEERCAARKLSRPLAHGPCGTLAEGQRSELVC